MKYITNEIQVIFRTLPVWSYLSHFDIKSRFRRSVAGIFWLVLHQLAFSLGAGVIWANLFGLKPGEFIPFLTLGFAIWGFIAASLSDGCLTFLNASVYLKQLKVNQSTFIARAVYTQAIYFAIGVGTALCILIFFGKFTIVGILYAIPGLVLLILTSYGVMGTTAYIGMRFRDVQHAITGLLSLLFVSSPVIYPAEILVQRGLEFVVYFNPIAAFLEIVRYPILNSSFADGVYYIVALGTASVFIFTRFYFQKTWGRYIVFWV